jgi:hypothetical protein
MGVGNGAWINQRRLNPDGFRGENAACKTQPFDLVIFYRDAAKFVRIPNIFAILFLKIVVELNFQRDAGLIQHLAVHGALEFGQIFVVA